MNEVLALFDAFLNSPEGLAVKGLVIGSILTFAVGVFAALRDGTFDLSYLDTFVRNTLWGKVAPVMVFLFIGYAFNEPLVSGPAIIAAGAVAVSMIKAAVDSIVQLTMDKTASAAANKLPEG
jgi:hypothetical protein